MQFLTNSWTRRRLLQVSCFGGAALASTARAQLSLPTSKNSKDPSLSQPEVSLNTNGSFFDFDVVTVNDQGTLVERREGRAEVKRENLGGGVELELVGIPGGTFTMGSPEDEEGRYLNEGPQHEVAVPSFWMGKYAVTQAQWRAIAAQPKVDRELNPDPSLIKGDNRPVEGVTWYDTVEFCKRLSRERDCDYRLPSEAEWEYACRAGTETPFHFGETITTELANYRTEHDLTSICLNETPGCRIPSSLFARDSRTYYGAGPRGEFRAETMEVGSFPPNGFGLYDMHGNVWEWCADYGHDSYADAPPGGSPWITGGDESYRMSRGGSWNDYPRNCRSAIRIRFPNSSRYFDIGFRVVCSSA